MVQGAFKDRFRTVWWQFFADLPVSSELGFSYRVLVQDYFSFAFVEIQHKAGSYVTEGEDAIFWAARDLLVILGSYDAENVNVFVVGCGEWTPATVPSRFEV